MKISREKVNHLSSLIVKDFSRREELDYKAELNQIRLEITRVMLEELKLDDQADTEARKILNSYSSGPREGSPEWDILYQKHYEDQLNKLGL